MTKTERRQVAAVLRKWAAWCEANPRLLWFESPPPYPIGTFTAALPFCQRLAYDGLLTKGSHRGPTAATGLLLAAAAVEAGDVP